MRAIPCFVVGLFVALLLSVVQHAANIPIDKFKLPQNLEGLVLSILSGGALLLGVIAGLFLRGRTTLCLFGLRSVSVSWIALGLGYFWGMALSDGSILLIEGADSAFSFLSVACALTLSVGIGLSEAIRRCFGGCKFLGGGAKGRRR